MALGGYAECFHFIQMSPSITLDSAAMKRRKLLETRHSQLGHRHLDDFPAPMGGSIKANEFSTSGGSSDRIRRAEFQKMTSK